MINFLNINQVGHEELIGVDDGLAEHHQAPVAGVLVQQPQALPIGEGGHLQSVIGDEGDHGVRNREVKHQVVNICATPEESKSESSPLHKTAHLPLVLPAFLPAVTSTRLFRIIPTRNIALLEI